MNGGDLTRSTFRPYKHYSGVRMQQGRVQLDADWNEQLDLAAHRARAEVVDVIGSDGVPKVDGGFELTLAPDLSDLLLGAGRAWAGGQLCEVDGAWAEVTAAPDVTTVVIDSVVLDGLELHAQEWVEVRSDTASAIARTTAVDVAARTLTLDAPLDGLAGPLRVRRRLSYATQPDLPGPDLTSRASTTAPRVLDLPDGRWLAYLDVWERAVTALDDPTISEPALGVDTATRSQVVWQVRLLDLAGFVGPVGCDADFGPALAAATSSTATMAARAEPPAGSADLCRPTPAGGYVGLENQLYRLHVHDVVDGRPVILWSRENASVATTWVGNAAPDVLQVGSIGRDAVLGFQPGDWVELLDDSCVLHQRPGTLVRLLNAKGTQLVLDPATATGSTSVADFGPNPQVRRWDSDGPVDVPDGWLELENGVQVRFSPGGTFRRHDYWLVPARSSQADIDWPRDSTGTPVALGPTGVEHSTATLGIVTRQAGALAVSDCRDLFPALTALTAGDVAVGNTVCQLPGVETVQDAIDALCRSNDLRRHNRLLHGFGIVCGLAVRCGDEGDLIRGPRPQVSTAERRRLFPDFTLASVRALPDLDARLDPELDLDEVRERVLRRTVTVQPGSAIDADGNDLDVSDPVVLDVLSEVASLGDGVLDQAGDGEVALVLRRSAGGPGVVVTRFTPREDGDWLDGTLISDIYEECFANLIRWVRAQVTPRAESTPQERQQAYLLRTALTDLLTSVANPRSGDTVYVSVTEHELLTAFYQGLRKRLRSQAFCAMFDDARPYPDYPAELLPLRTISGVGWHSRVRVHPEGREAWTTGGGINPLRSSTMLNRYSLVDGTLMAQFDPVSGKKLALGETSSTTAAPVSDVAFSADGRLIFVAVPTRDDNDTLFRVGEITDDDVSWRPATTICGVKLVSLATTAADPDHVYAVAVKRTATRDKAFSLRQFTGAGVFQIPWQAVPDALTAIPDTAAMNTTGQLEISAAGEAVFACGQPGQLATSYDHLVTMRVPTPQLVNQIPLPVAGSDDLTLMTGSPISNETLVWTATGSGDNRQLVAHGVTSAGFFVQTMIRETAGRLALQSVRNRILLTDSDSSLTRVYDSDRQEFLEALRIPVQVAPMSVSAASRRPRQVVVLNAVSNSLTTIDLEVLFGEAFDLQPLVTYRRQAVEAFADLVGGFAQYVKDCVCDHLLVRCPPKRENQDLDLAVVSIRGGSVYKVCNFSRRRYVKSFPTVGYWLSMVPVLPALRELVGIACCTVLPELFGKYSTAGNDNADDRVAASEMLRFLELVQGEDVMSRLRDLDLGGVTKLFRGINEGAWGGQAVRPVQPRSGMTASTENASVLEPMAGRPSRSALVIRNVLRNPDVLQEIANIDLSLLPSGSVPSLIEQLVPVPEPPSATALTDAREAPGSGELQALLERVQSLEASLAELQKPSAPPRKSATRPRKRAGSAGDSSSTGVGTTSGEGGSAGAGESPADRELGDGVPGTRESSGPVT